LNYLNARYYDGARGQFMSQDPVYLNLSKLDIQLSDPQSWNSYSYSRNNPIVYVDQSGEFWQIVAGAAVGATLSGGITYLQTGNVKQSLNAAAGGAVTGAMFAAVGPASLASSTAIGALSVTAGNSLTRTFNGEEINAGTLAVDATTGAIGGAAGYGTAKIIQNVVTPKINNINSSASELNNFPIRPTAIPKLNALSQQFGISKDEILQQASQSTQKYLDNKTGNINIWVPKPNGVEGFIRVTTNPGLNAIISAGQNGAKQVVNGITNGRFTPLK